MTAKADRAREFLNSPVFQEALENLRNQYRKAFESERISDEDANEVRRMLFLTRKLEAHLEAIINAGELEDFRANEQDGPTFLGDLIKWPKN